MSPVYGATKVPTTFVALVDSPTAATASA